MTTETPTDYQKAEALLKRAFARACRRYKLDPQQAAALAQSLSASDAPAPLPTLPDTAPELWSDRVPGRENPAQFTRRVYAPWIGLGFDRRNLFKLDSVLYNRLSVWEMRHPQDRIAELPTLQETIDARIDEMLQFYPLSTLQVVSSNIAKRIRAGRLMPD